MNRICGIYKITSPTGKIYIGQSVNINKRIGHYKCASCKEQVKLYHSIKKHGWSKHQFEILCECDKTELNDLEKHYIKFYDTFNTEHGLNLSDGGHTTKFTKESREKISKSKLGKKRPKSVRKKISKFKLGKKTHPNFKYSPHEYEIYNNSNELVYKFKLNVKKKLKELNLPLTTFSESYRNNTKIKHKIYMGWYMVKL